ncbi:MAG: polysaccharide deacetylase family protein [Bauldia sp.]
MTGIRQAAIRATLETLYFSGAHRLARPFLAGMGAILTFHHVRPPRTDAFQPNRHLEVSPGFLDEVIAALRRVGVDIVSIDEAHRRLTEGRRSRRFVVLTFDDGYRDNRTFAWPVLERHQAPFTLYVASAFAEGGGGLWWLMLEEAVARNDRIEVEFAGGGGLFDCSHLRAKTETFGTLYRYLRQCNDQAGLDRAAREIAAAGGVDLAAQCVELCMGWDELSHLAGSPLATIGAHTVNHVILSKVSDTAARREMAASVDRIDEALGVRPRHLAYPVGDPSSAGRREFAIAAELGFRTAVTTRPGVLFAEHADQLTALPRISVNGDFQRLRYLDVLLSGAPTALMSGLEGLRAA